MPAANCSNVRSSNVGREHRRRGVTASPARRGGAAQAAALRGAWRCALPVAVACAARLPTPVAGEEAARSRRAEDIAAAGGIERLDEARYRARVRTERSAVGRSTRSIRAPDRRPLPASRRIPAPPRTPRPGSERDHQHRHARASACAASASGSGRAAASRPRSAAPRRSSRTSSAAFGSGWSTRMPSCCMPRKRLCRSA